MKVLVLNGPNLGRLGRRQPEIYGTTTHDQLAELCAGWGRDLGLDVETRQTNHEGELLDWLNQAADDRTRAAVHLGRGDCFRLTGKYREAMWEYLWVDSVYNEDREKQAKAVYYLHELFSDRLEMPNAKDYAKECQDRLKTQARLQDTYYQKLFVGR